MWAIRLLHESNYHEKKSFVTLTFDDDHVPDQLSILDVQLWLKRVRKHYPPKSIKYFACGEYGDSYEGTHRPHYHAILFGSEDPEIINKTWTNGFVDVGDVTPRSCAYVAGYVSKKFGVSISDVDRQVPFRLMSRGLGLSWANDNREKISENGLTLNGNRVAIPRYYKDKLKIDSTLSLEELEKVVDNWRCLGEDNITRQEVARDALRQRELEMTAQEGRKRGVL